MTNLLTIWISIKLHWRYLVTEQKMLFRSATIWVAAVIAALPDILSIFSSLAHYMPAAFASQGLKWLAIAVFLARMRTLIRIPKES